MLGLGIHQAGVLCLPKFALPPEIISPNVCGRCDHISVLLTNCGHSVAL